MNVLRVIATTAALAALAASPTSAATMQACPGGCQCIGNIKVCPLIKPAFTAKDIKTLQKALKGVSIK